MIKHQWNYVSNNWFSFCLESEVYDFKAEKTSSCFV